MSKETEKQAEDQNKKPGETEVPPSDSSSDKGKQYHIQKRLAKKKDREAEKARQRAEALEQENKLLKKQLNPGPGEKPTLEACGGDTDRFERELSRWYEGQADQKADEKASNRVKEFQQEQALESRDAKMQKQIDAHYDKVIESKIEGYDQAEANAIDWLGEQIVNGIIEVTDNSPEVIHFLGSNEEEAEALLEILKKSPAKGTAYIGRLSAKVDKFSKKPGEDDELEPDESLSGGGAPQTHAQLKRRHDKLVADIEAGKTDLLPQLRKVRADMRAEGILPD